MNEAHLFWNHLMWCSLFIGWLELQGYEVTITDAGKWKGHIEAALKTEMKTCVYFNTGPFDLSGQGSRGSELCLNKTMWPSVTSIFCKSRSIYLQLPGLLKAVELSSVMTLVSFSPILFTATRTVNSPLCVVAWWIPWWCNLSRKRCCHRGWKRYC